MRQMRQLILLGAPDGSGYRQLHVGKAAKVWAMVVVKLEWRVLPKLSCAGMRIR
jgi:hypothetical protein